MRKIVLCSLVFGLFFGSLSAQDIEYHTDSRKAIRYFEDAREFVSSRRVEMAINAAKEATIEDEEFLEAWVLLSELYYFDGQMESFENALRKVVAIEPEFDPGYFLRLAELSYQNGKYQQGLDDLDEFEEYSNRSLEKNTMYRHVKDKLEFAVEAMKNPVDYDPVNLGSNVNTKYDDYWPSLTADEQRLVTTVLVPSGSANNYYADQFQEDLYETIKDDQGEWYPIRNMGRTINSSKNEGAQCISVDGNMCIFTACNRRDGYGSCDLYVSYKEGDSWGRPDNLGRPVNTGFWESNPSLSADGKWLYYSSSDTSGYGKNDIWRVEIKPGLEFGQPENLGGTVNSPGADGSPFIHPDGRTLYFASNGHPGLGDFDLFVTRLMDDGSWTEPENLGYPINTHGEERSLIVNAEGDLAMISSEREGGYGGLDIYKFDLPEKVQPSRVTYVKGIVYDAETEKPLEAECRLLNFEDGSLAARQTSNRVDGSYLVVLPVGEEYAFNVDKSGYLFYSENFSLKDLEDPEEAYIMDIPLQPIREGKSVVLNNIFFDYDEFALKDESYAELSKLLEFLRKNPEVSIEIGGHTDNRGSAEYNKELSENRAKAVYSYLVDKGVSEDRLDYKGYGFEKPVADNDTEKGRAKNRRTEFKIVKINR
ncbi:MAG: OmpA family protein [Bacteroidales bacterium]